MSLNICFNCVNYEWSKPEDVNVLNCYNCKFARYCSKQCQEEQWFKVHKEQCKFLADSKVFLRSRHDCDVCPGCKEEKEIGRENIARIDNPFYG